MAHLEAQSGHTFHIPVMGTGFTVDTPMRVAKYGISSVISLVDDVLIEQMRKHYCALEGLPYEPIPNRDDDPRARRITAYLNLAKRLVSKYLEQLRQAPFAEGSDIWRYFSMLPDIPLKRKFEDMMASADPIEKEHLQKDLRNQVVAGSIDVNIMTKLDRETYRDGEARPAEFRDAMSALRGFAQSDLSSSIVFSAGMNKRLFKYISLFEDFYPDAGEVLKKKIILKVSDYRSAVIQGKILAKYGLWVSEYRIESGLNCGGHAFRTKGFLMGPILEEFKQNRAELIESTHAILNQAFDATGRRRLQEPLPLRITVQGGIGNASEDRMLHKYYQVDGTGWGTPFLLVPEVTNVDRRSLERLVQAREEDVQLSQSSPLGVPFWNLTTSASESARRKRILNGKPGSSCPKGFLSSNTEFTKTPICTASRAYQEKKLAALEMGKNGDRKHEVEAEKVMLKSCICHDLGGGATLDRGIDPQATSALCCGPNIVNFSRISTLDEMVAHIYGRISLLSRSDRPHMFIQELKLYVKELSREIEELKQSLTESTAAYLEEFRANLLDGVGYYANLAERFVEPHKTRFLDDLQALKERVESSVIFQEVGA